MKVSSKAQVVQDGPFFKQSHSHVQQLWQPYCNKNTIYKKKQIHHKYPTSNTNKNNISEFLKHFLVLFLPYVILNVYIID